VPCTSVSTFLQHPAITIRVLEVGETCVVAAGRIKTGRKPSVPRSNGCLVPDFADLYTAFDQPAPRSEPACATVNPFPI
jgi:hypothetical protein